jgi:hypothetical protein
MGQRVGKLDTLTAQYLNEVTVDKIERLFVEGAGEYPAAVVHNV